MKVPNLTNFNGSHIKYDRILPKHFVFLWFSGFEKPSAIQQRSILPIVKGRDVIAQAQSGKNTNSLTL